MVSFTEKKVDGNAIYDMSTRRLYVGGIITSPVVKFWYEGEYQHSLTQSGNVYITVAAKFVRYMP